MFERDLPEFTDDALDDVTYLLQGIAMALRVVEGHVEREGIPMRRKMRGCRRMRGRRACSAAVRLGWWWPGRFWRRGVGGVEPLRYGRHDGTHGSLSQQCVVPCERPVASGHGFLRGMQGRRSGYWHAGRMSVAELSRPTAHA